MPVLSCPHCGSASIVVGGNSDTDVCPRLRCGGIMDRHENEPDAAIAVRKALLAVDLVAEIQAEQAEIRRLSAIRRAAR